MRKDVGLLSDFIRLYTTVPMSAVYVFCILGSSVESLSGPPLQFELYFLLSFHLSLFPHPPSTGSPAASVLALITLCYRNSVTRLPAALN